MDFKLEIDINEVHLVRDIAGELQTRNLKLSLDEARTLAMSLASEISADREYFLRAAYEGIVAACVERAIDNYRRRKR